MRSALLTVVLLLTPSLAFAGDARVSATLKPEVVDVEAAARELAETYAAKVVAIDGNNVVVELSIARAGLVARDPHVAAVTVLRSAAASPPVQRSSAAPAPQRSFVPRTNNSCTPPGLPCSTGTYLYDGSGNIKQIGNDTLIYDAVSRLTSATLPSAGGVGETYTYDPFGNMQSVTSTMGEGRPTITTEKSTNHLDPVATQASYDEAGNLR
jgi:YD repeat-containing protein